MSTLFNTPRYKPESATSDGHRLTDTRIAIATEVDREMLTYLPFVPTAEDIDGCVQLLRDNGLLVAGNNGGLRWKDFPKPPSQLSGTEKVVFSPLKAIADVISEYSFTGDTPGRVETPHVKYRDCPDANVHSELRGATFKIDGCFELDKAGGIAKHGVKLAAPNIAVSAEFKKREEDWVDNRQKLVSAASHIMNDDPRRVFVFGFTIEDDKMALWYFSRSHSTKSKDFNFIRDYKQFISVFLSFIFADKAALGYDPMVHRSVTGGIAYTYQIPVDGVTRYFKSTGTLSSYRSLGITGRMTRVWKAIEVSSPRGHPIDGKKEVALKDVWLEDDATPEKAIQDSIFAEVKKQRDLRDNKEPSRLDLVTQWETNVDFEKVTKGDEYQKYFVKIAGDYQGVMTKIKPQDATPTTGLFFSNRPRDGGFRTHRIPGSDSTRDRGDVTRPMEPTVTQDRSTAPRSYRPKRRYIVVYSEICTALHDAVNLKTTFKALSDALIGWLHRDVSTGNILIFVDGETVTGKLSDLEYAKEFGSAAAHSDPKTGTPYFMALELLIGARHRTPKPPDLDDTFFVEAAAGDTAMWEQLDEPESAAGDTQNVVCNFQHDLESIFWIALWILLARVNYELSQVYAKLIFVNEIRATSERINILGPHIYLRKMLSQNLHPSLKSFTRVLASLAAALFNAYLTRDQENKVLEIDAYASVYPSVVNIFSVLTLVASKADEHKDFPGLIDLHTNKSIQNTNPTDSSPVADLQVGPSSTTSVSTRGSPEAVTLTTPVSAHKLPEAISPTNPTFLVGSSGATSLDQAPLSERSKRRQDESEDQELPPSKRFHLPPPEHVLRQ
ncbi:hypothetical protein P691DRAFT_790795 [Macrolepiota fuliginosa MF-IS2]|uniref:Protein kinase domain-containing protein n=1 Tax=Macrolepiota fuliginosa MF-IS2 TaxID=1400762 RepID=A0A9P5X2J6_9AGAR|nr:hypothetical protein P691DRAFT_790795 [Macrolepiota fuliginosa MF-IS2]